jgi:hypothetical protein
MMGGGNKEDTLRIPHFPTLLTTKRLGTERAYEAKTGVYPTALHQGLE